MRCCHFTEPLAGRPARLQWRLKQHGQVYDDQRLGMECPQLYAERLIPTRWLQQSTVAHE